MKQMSDEPYNVPTIPPDLRREEAVQQICDSLAYLDQVASDIFARINRRVVENRGQLAKLSDRIVVAQAKIDRIKGTNKATRVFSSAKYPAVDEETNYRSVFADEADRLRHPKPSKYVVHTKHDFMDEQVRSTIINVFFSCFEPLHHTFKFFILKLYYSVYSKISEVLKSVVLRNIHQS